MSLTCMPCVDSSQCSGGACAQYGGDDYCATFCKSDSDCASGEQCSLMVATDATEVQICVPQSASCGGASGCASCAAGTTCDVVTGQCVPSSGGSGSGSGGSPPPACPGYAGPSESSCCQSCTAGSGSCQANGCYGGWYCDSSTCKCHAPPTGCGTGGSGSGSGGGGTPPPPPPPVSGSVGPGGGTVSHLYFAVVGDTRPPNIDDTSGYPTPVITKIYSDIEALNPRPEFVVTTGDYMFASPSGDTSQPQIALYMQAARQFTGGPIFAAMGNHECTGATASNCATSPTNNMNAYMSALVTPLGQAKPYYTIPVSAENGQWTAKIVIAACNAWDSTQYSWLQSELAKPTTYTFVVRHEPTGTSGAPCVSQMDSLLRNSKYDLFIVGHSHTFTHSGQQVVIGNGGAPLAGSVNYGFATIDQQASGFVVTQYDYMTSTPVNSFTVP